MSDRGRGGLRVSGASTGRFVVCEAPGRLRRPEKPKPPKERSAVRPSGPELDGGTPRARTPGQTRTAFGGPPGSRNRGRRPRAWTPTTGNQKKETPQGPTTGEVDGVPDRFLLPHSAANRFRGNADRREGVTDGRLRWGRRKGTNRPAWSPSKKRTATRRENGGAEPKRRGPAGSPSRRAGRRIPGSPFQRSFPPVLSRARNICLA